MSEAFRDAFGSHALVVVDECETRWLAAATRNLEHAQDRNQLHPEPEEEDAENYAALQKNNRDRQMQYFQTTGRLGNLIRLGTQEETRFKLELQYIDQKKTYYRSEMIRMLEETMPSIVDPDAQRYVENLTKISERATVQQIRLEKEYDEWKEHFKVAKEACDRIYQERRQTEP